MPHVRQTPDKGEPLAQTDNARPVPGSPGAGKPAQVVTSIVNSEGWLGVQNQERAHRGIETARSCRVLLGQRARNLAQAH